MIDHRLLLRALPLEARSLHREMQTAAWFSGGRLVNDPAAIRTVIRATREEWDRAWPLIARLWRVEGPALVSDTPWHPGEEPYLCAGETAIEEDPT